MSQNVINQVVDVFTPTGLRPAIITSQSQDKLEGFLVRPSDHSEVLGQWTGTADDLIGADNKERGVVVTGAGNPELWVTVLSSAEGIVITSSRGHTTTRPTPEAAFKHMLNELSALGCAEDARAMKNIDMFLEVFIDALAL